MIARLGQPSVAFNHEGRLSADPVKRGFLSHSKTVRQSVRDQNLELTQPSRSIHSTPVSSLVTDSRSCFFLEPVGGSQSIPLMADD
jgi:hypothetical protein